MLYFITRLILVPLGFLLAVTAGSAVVILAQWLDYIRGTGLTEQDVFLLTAQGFTVFFVIGTLAFPLAAVLILVCEVLIVRSMLAYCAMGALVAFVVAAAVQRFSQLRMDVPDDLYWMDLSHLVQANPTVTLGAGFAAGLGYWLVAGRPGPSRRTRVHRIRSEQAPPPVATQ
jgi:hypothetical protein